MKITNEFTVHTPIERAWQVLTDLEGIAPCMPGAQLTGVEGEVYQGKVKVKVGPVISDFSGTAQFTAKDDANYRAVIDAKGRDARSAGNASALVTAVLTPEGENSTKVSVDTDLKISGKLAQFGSGMIKEVSGKLLAQFVTNLEAKLAADDAAPASAASASSASAVPASSAPAASASSGPASSAPASGPVSAPGAADLAAAPVGGGAAEGTASAAAVETAPDAAVSLGTVAPGVPDVDTSAAAPIAPDPSSGTVEPAAGRLETAEGTPEPIAPLNVPPADLTKAAGAVPQASGATADAPASSAAAASSDAPASSVVPASSAAPASSVAPASSAAPVERKIESAEPEALDLLDIAGKSIYKRVIPVVVGVAVAAAVIVWVAARP
ncbi:SRPBCC family protein [Actinoplanes sp. NPDC024001]|uniref:SRPBCC family protein n=1 Tax=Actinoplanes sp. NPDC024001 TaxID=3154598 RepID=UPI0033FBD095